MTDDPSVTIERLGHHGDGVASGPVFVPRTLPGEVVTGDRDGNRIPRPRIVTPSPDRVSPLCRHYKACGGCNLQHAHPDFVARWKQSVVEAALRSNGLDAPIRRLHTSPEGSRRRATFSGRRTKSGAIIGFHGPESGSIVAVPDCRVITPALIAAFPLFESLVSIGGTRKSEMKLLATDTGTGLDLVVSGGHAMDAELVSKLSNEVAGTSVLRLTWNGETIVQETRPSIALDGLSVPFPPGVFLQATREGEAALRASVTEAVGSARRIVDLFSGIGTFALPLARDAEVHAVEGEAAMTAALNDGWRHATGLRKVTTETRDLFRRPLLPDELSHFEAAVIDPPRAGAEAQIAELARSRIPRIAHVSCNPVTFARDAATLVAGGYQLVWIDVVDQFRWSNHTELVSLFEIKRT